MSKEKQQVNQFLVNIFNDILKIEEKALKTERLENITVTELHILDTIGKNQKRTMGEIANDLKITVGTLTTAINKLFKKGYVERTRIEKDRRLVFISLTEKGEEAYDIHQEFHQHMVDAAIGQLSQEEIQSFVSALTKIDLFFKEQYTSLNN